MKERWDKGKRAHPYKVGDLVYIRNKSRQVLDTSEKLQPLYDGPYLIIDLPSKFTAKLRNLQSGKTKKETIHVERLKRVNFKKLNSDIRM